MVKHRKTARPAPIRKRLKWWRSLLGALLAFFIVLPYLMGTDVEKYIRDWLTGFNQDNPSWHLELTHYERHWFTSDGDLIIKGGPLQNAANFHIRVFHGPLFLNAGHGIRFGLTLLKGTLDANSVFGQQEAVKFEGPLQLTAFIPYFSDRELHTAVPAITFMDKVNGLVYQLTALNGSIDSDGLLQLEIPSLTVSHLQGSTVFRISVGSLHFLPQNRFASLAAKKMEFFRENNTTTLSNLVLQSTAHDSLTLPHKIHLDLSMHVDKLEGIIAQPLDLGPFEFQLKVHGLHTQELTALFTLLKALALQQKSLSPTQDQQLEKTWSSLFAADTLYELTSKLATQSGEIQAQFSGGFKAKTQQESFKNSLDLSDAFYSKGKIQLTPDIKDALAQYLKQLHQPQDPENLPSNQEELALSVLLGFLKPDGQDYSATIAVSEGKITINGKKS